MLGDNYLPNAVNYISIDLLSPVLSVYWVLPPYVEKPNVNVCSQIYCIALSRKSWISRQYKNWTILMDQLISKYATIYIIWIKQKGDFHIWKTQETGYINFFVSFLTIWKMGAATKLVFAVFLISCSSGKFILISLPSLFSNITMKCKMSNHKYWFTFCTLEYFL